MRFGLSLSFCAGRGAGVGSGDADHPCGAVLWENKIEGEGCGVMEPKRARMVCGGWVRGVGDGEQCHLLRNNRARGDTTKADSSRVGPSRIVQVTGKNRSLVVTQCCIGEPAVVGI